MKTRRTSCKIILLCLCFFTTTSCNSILKSRTNRYVFSAILLSEPTQTNYAKLAFIPDYDRLKLSAEHLAANFYYGAIPNADSLVNLYNPVDAVGFTLAAAENKTILILNEAHHQPQHRMFALNLLKGLKERGYTKLGIEALTNAPHFYLKGEPKRRNGYYLAEPSFGHFIREALQLGFQIFPYEAPGEYDKAREVNQAKNILKYLDENPDGKTFIYCGFSHNDEGIMPDTWEKSMAGWLHEFSGINSLTVNQFIYTNVNAVKGDEPIVLVDEKGQAVQPLGNRFNITIFHPNYNQPNHQLLWKLKPNDTLIPVKFIPEDAAYPVMVAAFADKKSVKKGIPLDIIELKTAKEKEWLCVPKIKENYFLIAYDAKRKRINL